MESAANFSFSPPEAENSITNSSSNSNEVVENVAAAASETEGDREVPTSSFPLSTAVDIGPDTHDKKKNKKKEKPQASFWSRLTEAAAVVEEHLAEWFGLNDSKYQWAVDEVMNRQLAGESQVKQAPSEAPHELQAMHRDRKEADYV